jgi:hypothetical protein
VWFHHCPATYSGHFLREEQQMTHAITRILGRGGRAARSLGPAAVAVTAALIIGAAGFADAATGGTFLLGRSNTDNATSVLTDSTGVPLSLNAPSGKSPLSVNSATQVNRLNAQYVGGRSASQLRSTGGYGITAAAADIPLTSAYATVAATGRLPAGTYYVTATAQLYTGGTDPAYCVIIPGPTDNGGGGNANFYSQATEVTIVTVPASTVIKEDCLGDGTGQSVYNAAITAIRVASSSAGTRPTLSDRPVRPSPARSPRLAGPPAEFGNNRLSRY